MLVKMRSRGGHVEKGKFEREKREGAGGLDLERKKDEIEARGDS